MRGKRETEGRDWANKITLQQLIHYIFMPPSKYYLLAIHFSFLKSSADGKPMLNDLVHEINVLAVHVFISVSNSFVGSWKMW
jgi:hypothetical protein